MNHSQARTIIIGAFTQVIGREPTRPEAQCVQAIGALETQYGAGWRGAGVGSRNWGAIQCGASWPGDRFLYSDTHPNDDGTSTTYRAHFRKYPTDEDGAADLVRVVYCNKGRDQRVLVPAMLGDTLGFSRGLYQTGYYEGFGPTVESRVRNHHNAVRKCLLAAAREIGEPWPDGSPLSQVTLRRGSIGPAVREWQRLMGLVADGVFGPITETATIKWQQEHGAKPDGVVGPATWETARRIADVDEEPTQPDPQLVRRIPTTLRRGSTGPVVREWQYLLGIVADGVFGPITEIATRAWQSRHAIKADGIVGPLTWEAAAIADA